MPTPERTRIPERLQPIQRVLIANRGEIALRILDTCRKENIGAVVGFSLADANSLPVRMALELEKINDRFAAAYLGDTPAHRSYDRVEAVINAAYAYEADAVHPGYGFLAENETAARRIREAGLRFIGPQPEVIEQVGNKAGAREVAKKVGVPMLPGTGILKNFKDARSAAHKLHYPIMLKAANAGGGIGNRVAHSEDELKTIFPQLTEAFGDVYLEKYIADAKHIEVQFAGDKYGNVIALGTRDCSAQRKMQKVVEESPPNIALSQRDKVLETMQQDAVKIGKAVGYQNLGTCEFLYDQATGKYYFIEINTRIQVEHPVTEERTGLDLIKMQLDIEAGKSLPPTIAQKDNHVIEVRVYAEKPQQGFQGDSGTVHIGELPQAEGIRIDRAYEDGDTIPPDYDKTIMKIIATNSTRESAVAKLAVALSSLEITGVATNKDFLLWLIETDEFKNGTISTTFIEEAWQNHLRNKLRGVSSFLEGGEFNEFPITKRFVTGAYAQSLEYTRKNKEGNHIARNYGDEMHAFQQENPENCAFRFGTFKESGMEFMLGIWDYSKFGGTLATEEATAVATMFKVAKEKHMPVYMITNSGGARQPENAQGLHGMDYITATYERFQPSLFVNVYHHMSFGGVNASIASLGDIQVMTDGSVAGLTGPDIVAMMIGRKDRTELPPGAHSAQDHFWARNIDVVAGDLKEAKLRFLQTLRVLGYPYNPTEGSDPLEIQSRTHDALTPVFNRPSEHRFNAIMGGLGHFAGTIFHRSSQELRVGDHTPTIEERLQYVMDLNRPTAIDLLRRDSGIFDAVVDLSNQAKVGTDYQTPPIIGALTRIGNQPFLVLAQTSQRVKDDAGNTHKLYVPAGPRDYRWAQRKVAFAEHAQLPIILIGDTNGAAADLAAEYDGISNELAQFLRIMHTVNVPVFSLNIGQTGSGGGLTFIRPVDALAELQYALTFVSTIEVQSFILSGEWPNEETKRKIMNQLRDATVEWRRHTRYNDLIIREPAGGVKTSPEHLRFVGSQIRSFLVEEARKQSTIPPEQRRMLRYDRSRRAAEFATRPV